MLFVISVLEEIEVVDLLTIAQDSVDCGMTGTLSSLSRFSAKRARDDCVDLALVDFRLFISSRIRYFRVNVIDCISDRCVHEEHDLRVVEEMV